MKGSPSIARKIVYLFLVIVLLYLGLGLGFHILWKRALEDCRELRMSQGEFVEPEVFGNFIGVAFDLTFWPVYASANIYHDGTPLATPCTHPRWTPMDVNSPPKEGEIRHLMDSFGNRL